MTKKLMGMALLCLIGFSSAASTASSDGVPVVGWRTDTTGRYLDATPTIEWTAEKNVVWKTKMPNWSNASPLIIGDRMFVCSEPTTLICVQTSDGEILWQRDNTYLDTVAPDKVDAVKKLMEEIDIDATTKEFRSAENKLKNRNNKLKKETDNAELKQEVEDLTKQVEQLKTKLEPVAEYVIPKTHGTNGYSSSTPTSDGKNVYVLFGTGVAACYDLDGNRKWIKIIEKPTHDWGHSSSPVLVGDKLIIHVRSLFALDKETGETVWKKEATVKWGTAELTNIGGVDIIITPNGDFFRASDGKILRKREKDDKAFLEFARPIVHNGIVYFIQHEGKAFKLPSEAGDTLVLEELWQTMPKKDRYYASSVYHEGLIYGVVRQGHFFSVIDATTGEVILEEQLKLGKGTTYPSIILAGKYLFVSNDNGTTVVMEPGREPKEVGRNTLEAFRSSPVFIGKRMYIRGMENLYCIGE